jgi:hypothetical protein
MPRKDGSVEATWEADDRIGAAVGTGPGDAAAGTAPGAGHATQDGGWEDRQVRGDGNASGTCQGEGDFTGVSATHAGALLPHAHRP